MSSGSVVSPAAPSQSVGSSSHSPSLQTQPPASPAPDGRRGGADDGAVVPVGVDAGGREEGCGDGVVVVDDGGGFLSPQLPQPRLHCCPNQHRCPASDTVAAAVAVGAGAGAGAGAVMVQAHAGGSVATSFCAFHGRPPATTKKPPCWCLNLGRRSESSVRAETSVWQLRPVAHPSQRGFLRRLKPRSPGHGTVIVGTQKHRVPPGRVLTAAQGTVGSPLLTRETRRCKTSLELRKRKRRRLSIWLTEEGEDGERGLVVE